MRVHVTLSASLEDIKFTFSGWKYFHYFDIVIWKAKEKCRSLKLLYNTNDFSQCWSFISVYGQSVSVRWMIHSLWTHFSVWNTSLSIKDMQHISTPQTTQYLDHSAASLHRHTKQWWQIQQWGFDRICTLEMTCLFLDFITVKHKADSKFLDLVGNYFTCW